MKKIRLDSKPTFKKKGHEQQFLFNEQVREKLVDNVGTALDQTPPAVEKIRSLVNEGEKLLDRQENIKIADRSEYGWATVAEYEEDELAANSGDEKRLQRAEQSACRKQKSSKEVEVVLVGSLLKLRGHIPTREGVVSFCYRRCGHNNCYCIILYFVLLYGSVTIITRKHMVKKVFSYCK